MKNSIKIVLGLLLIAVPAIFAFQNCQKKKGDDLPNSSGSAVTTTTQAHVFSPDDILGLSVWFKADAITPIADGANLVSWPDSSHNSLDVYQSSPAAQPIYKVAALNGKPVVQFSGAQYLVAPASSAATPPKGTLIAVYSNSDASGGVRFVAGVPFSATATTWGSPWVGFQIGSSLPYGRFWLNIAGTDREFTAGTVAQDTYITQTLEFDGTARSGFIDGISVYSDSSAAGNISYDGIPSFVVGTRSSTAKGEYLKGNIAEILFYDSALSENDRKNVEDYLRVKYSHY